MKELVEMKRVLVLIAGAVLVVAAPAAATFSGLPGGPNVPQPLVTFVPGSFPESLAVRDGTLYVSLGFLGQVVEVTQGAEPAVSPYGSTIPIGNGLLTGLAFDGAGDLFVATATFADDPAPGVFEIPAGGGTAERVLTLPAESFPNGLAFRDGVLYVSDSALGVIWRAVPGQEPERWYEDALLAPWHGLGANGIAFDASGRLYVVVADSGRVVRLSLADGAVSSVELVAERAQLKGADGIAFDTAGDLYVAVNDSNRLYRLSPTDGSLTRLADRSDGLSYPTQPAFDTRPGSTTLYLTNGAFMNGVPDVESFDAGAAGLPLP